MTANQLAQRGIELGALVGVGLGIYLLVKHFGGGGGRVPETPAPAPNPTPPAPIPIPIPIPLDPQRNDLRVMIGQLDERVRALATQLNALQARYDWWMGAG